MSKSEVDYTVDKSIKPFVETCADRGVVNTVAGKGVFESITNAEEAKEVFGDNYVMYCNWCYMWVTADCVQLLPVSEDVWRTL